MRYPPLKTRGGVGADYDYGGRILDGFWAFPMLPNLLPYALTPNIYRKNGCDEARRIGIEIRAGLHTGEIELIGEDIGGLAVHIAARVMAKAQASEAWVSRTVKDLVVGSGFEFSEKGIYDLKGISGEWRLFTVER